MSIKGRISHEAFGLAGMGDWVEIKVTKPRTAPPVLVRRSDLTCTGIKIQARWVPFADRHCDGLQPRTARLSITGVFHDSDRTYRCELKTHHPEES